MTEEAIKKIGTMYNLFGRCENHEAICKNCKHLTVHEANRRWYKCECYGESSSDSTDWRCSWLACGLYNRPYDGKPVIEVKKHTGRKKKEEQIDGQLDLCL